MFWNCNLRCFSRWISKRRLLNRTIFSSITVTPDRVYPCRGNVNIKISQTPLRPINYSKFVLSPKTLRASYTAFPFNNLSITLLLNLRFRERRRNLRLTARNIYFFTVCENGGNIIIHTSALERYPLPLAFSVLVWFWKAQLLLSRLRARFLSPYDNERAHKWAINWAALQENLNVECWRRCEKFGKRNRNWSESLSSPLRPTFQINCSETRNKKLDSRRATTIKWDDTK